MCIPIYINNIVYPCKICHINVDNEHSAAQCDICQSWVHMKCNKPNQIDYKYLHGSNDPWYYFLLEHKQIKTSSFPSRQQTLSLKVPIVQ